MKKTIPFLTLMLILGAGLGAHSYVSDKNDSRSSDSVSSVSSPHAKPIKDPIMLDENLDIEIALTDDFKVPQIQQVTLDLPEIKVIEIKSIELTKIKLPQAAIELPELKQLKVPEFKEDSLPLEYQDPGSAESVIVGVDSLIKSNGPRTLKIDPQVIQSVQQQTGIPSYEIEQAFTKD